MYNLVWENISAGEFQLSGARFEGLLFGKNQFVLKISHLHLNCGGSAGKSGDSGAKVRMRRCSSGVPAASAKCSNCTRWAAARGIVGRRRVVALDPILRCYGTAFAGVRLAAQFQSLYSPQKMLGYHRANYTAFIVFMPTHHLEPQRKCRRFASPGKGGNGGWLP